MNRQYQAKMQQILKNSDFFQVSPQWKSYLINGLIIYIFIKISLF